MATHREALELLRDQLTATLKLVTQPRDVAGISRELRLVWAELEGLPVPGSKAPVDLLAQRREERRRKQAAGE